MAKIEIYKTLTIGGENFFIGTVHDESDLGPGAKGYRKRGLIGPLTKETKAAISATQSATERPIVTKEPRPGDAANDGTSGATGPNDAPNGDSGSAPGADKPDEG